MNFSKVGEIYGSRPVSRGYSPLRSHCGHVLVQQSSEHCACRASQTFMGDDTWISLLPDTFHKVVAVPSLNIHDVESVDEAVWKVRNL